MPRESASPAKYVRDFSCLDAYAAIVGHRIQTNSYCPPKSNSYFRMACDSCDKFKTKRELSRIPCERCAFTKSHCTFDHWFETAIASVFPVRPRMVVTSNHEERPAGSSFDIETHRLAVFLYFNWLIMQTRVPLTYWVQIVCFCRSAQCSHTNYC